MAARSPVIRLTEVTCGSAGKLKAQQATATQSNPRIRPIDMRHKAHYVAGKPELAQGIVDGFSRNNPLRDMV
jgi:hypothetical protein